MPFAILLENLLRDRSKSSTDLVHATGHTPANVSRLKRGKVRAVRFSTLHAICEELDCQPGDILKHVSEHEAMNLEQGAYLIDLSDKNT